MIFFTGLFDSALSTGAGCLRQNTLGCGHQEVQLVPCLTLTLGPGKSSAEFPHSAALLGMSIGGTNSRKVPACI